MSVWREVQEALLARWVASWVDDQVPAGKLTDYVFGNEKFEPADGQPWVRVLLQRRPGGPGTLGRPGNRKMDRRGVVFALVRVPPNTGDGQLSDLAEKAGKLFEGCRLEPHDIRFSSADPGIPGDVDQGRWWGVAVEAAFDYQDTV